MEPSCPPLSTLVKELRGADRINLSPDDELAKREIRELVRGVAIKKLGGKKKQDSYRLSFEVHLNDGTREWLTITTHKQSLKMSVRSMQVMRGLVANMSPEQFENFFRDDVSTKFKVHEIRRWMQKGGTDQWGVMLWNAQVKEWQAFKRITYLGLTPALATVSETKRLPANQAFAALNDKAPVDDYEPLLHPDDSFGRRMRNRLRRESLKRFGSRMLTWMPMSEKFAGDLRADSHKDRIDKTAAVLRKYLKHQGGSEWLRDRLSECRQTAARHPQKYDELSHAHYLDWSNSSLRERLPYPTSFGEAPPALPTAPLPTQTWHEHHGYPGSSSSSGSD